MKKILITFMIFAGFSASYAESYFMTVGTGGLAGSYYPIGVAVGKLINIDRREHGIRVTVEPTGGSVANINSLKLGIDTMAMAIVQSDVQYNYYNGGGKNLRALFGLHSEACTIVVRKDANVKSFEDLRGKRFNLGNQGSGTRNTMNTLLVEYGWADDAFARATAYDAAEMVAAFCENRIDGFAYVIGNPNNAVTEALDCGGELLSVSGQAVESLVKKYPYLPKAVIKGNTYKSNSADTLSFGPKATFVTTSELPENVAYEITKAVYNNFDKFVTMHPALSSMKKEDMLAGNTAPYHPGAIRFYREVGLMR